MACTNGISEAFKQEREKAKDMETVAMAFSSMVNNRYSEKNEQWAQGLIKGKFEKHKDVLNFKWSEDDTNN